MMLLTDAHYQSNHRELQSTVTFHDFSDITIDSIYRSPYKLKWDYEHGTFNNSEGKTHKVIMNTMANVVKRISDDYPSPILGRKRHRGGATVASIEEQAARIGRSAYLINYTSSWEGRGVQ